MKRRCGTWSKKLDNAQLIALAAGGVTKEIVDLGEKGPGPSNLAITAKKRIDIAMAISVRAGFQLFHEHEKIQTAALERMEFSDPLRWKVYTALWKPFPMKAAADTKKEPAMDSPTVFCDRCITTPAESECPHCAHNYCDWCLVEKHQRRCRNGVARTACVVAATVAAAIHLPPGAIAVTDNPRASVKDTGGKHSDVNIGSDSDDSACESEDTLSDHDREDDAQGTATGYEDADIGECPFCGKDAQLIETLCCSSTRCRGCCVGFRRCETHARIEGQILQEAMDD